MFAKAIVLFTTLSAILVATSASPVPQDPAAPAVDAPPPASTDAPADLPADVNALPNPTDGGVDVSNIPTSNTQPEIIQQFPTVSFDGWGGYGSLKGFDNFYGVDNWDGYKFKQVFVKKEKELVCRVQQVQIIQQRLLVLQELAKKIVIEQICEVEVQTIVFEQFRSGLHGFGRDLIRFPGHHQVGYDEKIVSHFPKIIGHDGLLTVDDWGFTGHDLGKNTVIVKGSNWDDRRSFRTVQNAWHTARNAYVSLYGRFF